MWLGVLRWLFSTLLTGLTLALLAGLLWYGHHHNWKFGHTENEAEDEPADEPPDSVLWHVVLLSEEAIVKTGLRSEGAHAEAIQETLLAPAVLRYDPMLHTHLAPRASGTVWRVLKQPGDAVVKGEVLALIEAAEVGKAKSDFLNARHLLELRDKAYRRSLAASGALPERQLLEIEFAYQQARVQQLTAQQALINFGLPIAPDDWRTLTDEQVLTQLRKLGLPQGFPEGGRTELLSTNLLPLVSPISGRVVHLDAGLGEAVSPAQPVCQVAALDPILMQAEIRAEDAEQVSLKMLARFQPDGQASPVTGPVVWISPEVDEKTRTVRVRVRLPNPDGRLRPNAFGTGAIVTSERTGVVVPRAAIQTVESTSIVFVELDPGYYLAQPVTTGVVVGDRIEVTGLMAGERVVTTGSHQLKAELLKEKIRGEE